jgi:asparagine synthase (glutamine-hydrolysing)
MSGFFAIVHFDGRDPDEKLLERLARHLRFRGPQGTHIWKQGELGGAFTLLEVGPQRHEQRQPVLLAGRYLLWGDIRLDARRELISRLSLNRVRPLEEASSEELLLEAWHIWGENCLPRLAGDFSFGLWDAQEKSFYCARDFVGARPLFYARTSEMFCFTNTLQILRELPGISGHLDELFIGDFLVQGLCSDPTRTVYRDIHRLAPGHALKCSAEKLRVWRFLTLPVEEPLHLQEPQEYVEAYLELLRETVQDRLPHGATALYLSGGLDSSSVCATAARIAETGHFREKLKAFTISWQPWMEDPEPDFAKLTAQHLGLAHELLDDPHVVPNAGEEMLMSATPEPSIDVFYDRARKQFQKIAAHAHVVLSGDGGDDILSGQAWPYLLHLLRRGAWRGIAAQFGGYFVSHGGLPPLRGGFRKKLRQWLKPEHELEGYPKWLNPDFERRSAVRERSMQLKQTPKREHPVHPEAYASLHGAYWASVLQAEEAGWTGVPLEPRAPLLDLRLLRLLLRLPPVPWCVDKELTRRAMRGLLPSAILSRPKTPMLQDPLDACREKALWKPEVPHKPPDGIHQYVNWEMWSATLESTKGFLDWGNAGPYLLALWLKGIENEKVIQ